jgi:hypothetical protein
MSRFFYIIAFLISCSQTAALTTMSVETETMPVDNSVDSGELEDTAG